MNPTPLYLLAGYVAFRLATWGLIPDKTARKYWDARIGVALVAALVLWKLTPVFTHWDAVLDNPLLLLYMNGGFPAWLGAAAMGLSMVALGLWQVRKNAVLALWRLVVPLAAGAMLTLALVLAEPWWSPTVSVAFDAKQMLVTAMEGGSTAVAEAKGQVLVVNFWATWCPPCKAELPDLLDFNKRMGKKITLWGVDLLGTETGIHTVKAYVKEHSMAWRQLVDDGSLQKAFNVTAVPTTLVFNASGELVERRTGAVDLSWLLGLETKYAN